MIWKIKRYVFEFHASAIQLHYMAGFSVKACKLIHDANLNTCKNVFGFFDLCKRAAS